MIWFDFVLVVLSVHNGSMGSLVAKFMGPTWGPPGADRTQVCPMLVPWTYLRCLYSYHLTEAETKRPSFCRQHFWRHFLEWRYVWISIEISLNFFPRVQSMICQHWFRSWLGAHQATNHYLNQWWLSLLTHICITQPQCAKRQHIYICLILSYLVTQINTLRPRQNGCHFPHDFLKGFSWKKIFEF